MPGGMLLSGCGGLTRRYGVAWRRCRAQRRAAPVQKVSRECSKRRAKCDRQSPVTGDIPVGFAPPAANRFQAHWSTIWRGKSTIFGRPPHRSFWRCCCGRRATPIYRGDANSHRPDGFACGRQRSYPANQANDAAVLQVESQVRVLTSDNVLRRVISRRIARPGSGICRPAVGERIVAFRHAAPNDRSTCRPERAAAEHSRSSAPSAPTWWT